MAGVTYERFEHRDSCDHGWSVLAFRDGRQVGGYIGPAPDHPEKCRCYCPCGGVADIPEGDCRQMIESCNA